LAAEDNVLAPDGLIEHARRRRESRHDFPQQADSI
jgi:hypothetical protein